MSDDYSGADESWISDITSDRAHAISMLAMFDSVFSDELRKCFVPLSNTQDDRIFGDRGPLGTLSAKIDLGFAIGLYGPQTKAILHTLRRIRNYFAHDHDVRDFGHPRVKQLCDSLPEVHDADGTLEENPGSKFNRTLLRIIARLNLQGQTREGNRPSPPSKLP